MEPEFDTSANEQRPAARPRSLPTRWNEFPRPFAIALLGTLCLAACVNAGPGVPAAAVAFTCEVFYRPSTTTSSFQETVLTLEESGVTAEVEFEDMAFSAQYFNDDFEGRSFSIVVSEHPGGTRLAAQLYQMDRTAAPRNEFAGGHGFTGLAYVDHPGSGAEMQFYCSAE